MGSRGHSTIVQVGAYTIKVMMLSSVERRIILREGVVCGRRVLKDVRKRGNGGGDSRSNSMVEESIEFARSKRRRRQVRRVVGVGGDMARVAGKVEDFIIVDIERVVVRAGGGIGGIFDQDFRTRKQRWKVT